MKVDNGTSVSLKIKNVLPQTAWSRALRAPSVQTSNGQLWAFGSNAVG
jgi:hypothetical protein